MRYPKIFAIVVGALFAASSHAADLPQRDTRGDVVIDLNTKRTFPKIYSADDWNKLAREIRDNTAVSCGLIPLREKHPLNANISGKIERDGYSVEKVHFQTIPGFYLSGNLYRPLGKGNGPFPGVLNPHGHWDNGRFADEKNGSVAGRCINFARMGMVAFTYDMVGYNDTPQLPHRQSFLNPTNQLWNISIMGLQTWNSIRALDFLSALPDVDTNRLACTGESGGGTQTFILGAVDPRLKVVAPIVMVSHQMQGGCVCENAPGLRVDHSNMEIAAAPSPKPQIVVSATGDWTRDVMTVEGPGIASVYKALGAPDNFSYLIYEAPHNYNQTTREAVYGWFDKWLLNAADAKPRPEPVFKKEPDDALRVFPDGKLPSDALKGEQVGKYLVTEAQRLWREALPKDAASLQKYRNDFGTIWDQSLQLHNPATQDIKVERKAAVRGNGYQSTRLTFGRVGKGDRLEGVLYRPNRATRGKLAILTHSDGMKEFLDANDAPKELAKGLLDAGLSVLCVQLFNPNDATDRSRNYFTNFFTTYNRTDIQERVQDLTTTAIMARKVLGQDEVVFIGQGRAGLWSMLAAPVANGVVADCAGFGEVTDQKLLARDLFAPGLRLFGDVEGAAILAMPNPTFVHNTGTGFPTSNAKTVAQNVKAKFEARESAADTAAIVKWVSAL